MFTKVLVEIVSGEICKSGQELYLDCAIVTRQGKERRRMVIPTTGKRQDVSAFYFSINGIEYGKIGADEENFASLCNHCCGSVGEDTGGSDWGEYNGDYRDDFFT